MMKARARAHTNIALIKYWGKRDQQLFLPMNSSLSLTLDAFYTTTTVSFEPDIHKDVFVLDGLEAEEEERMKISRFLDLVRGLGSVDTRAVVTSTNHVPYAAGFASSASAYAALAAAASKALDLSLDGKGLSILARQGSGSACRSVYGGFVTWDQGHLPDGSDSFARQILPENGWPLSVLSVCVTASPKEISSREGMARTVASSPFYEGWLSTVNEDLIKAKKAIEERDFIGLGQVSEANALKMHATMLGASPPISYWTPETMMVMDKVRQLRQEGYQAYFTIDAGPNVKVLCQTEDEVVIEEKLRTMPWVDQVIVCRPGPGITYLS